MFVVTEYKFFYIFYLLLVFYVVFSASYGKIEISCLIALCVTSYLGTASLLIYSICKIPLTRQFLDNLLGRNFVIIIKYLGLFTATKQAVKIVVPFAAVGVLDLVNDSESTYKASLNSDWCTDIYKQSYGVDRIRWPDKIKEEYIKEIASIQSDNPAGLVRTFGGYLHQSEMLGKITDALTGRHGRDR